jgi:predicted NBD/HSP70 family sugar kinase
MENSLIRPLNIGVNQSGVREHNERLLLTLLQRNGPTPGSELARLANLSPQTISNILRELEHEGLVSRGAPVRQGRVGKPYVPISLAENGVISFGCKIGRRNAVLLLMDFRGHVKAEMQISYEIPTPDIIFSFLEQGIGEMEAQCAPLERARICGIGIAVPFNLWKSPSSKTSSSPSNGWEEPDFAREISKFSSLSVHVVNDATAGCQAEHVYGRGKEFRDYAYFFIGAFVGGGIVLNHSVYQGHQGNAGALGALRTVGPHGESQQLTDTASIQVLEKRLSELGHDPRRLWDQPQDWSSYARLVEPWIGQTAQELAKASLSVCAVIDFEAILIDGAFPESVKQSLVERTRRYLANQDLNGLILPRVEAGLVGGNARAIGAATSPLFQRYFMNGNIKLPNLVGEQIQAPPARWRMR